MEAETKEDKEQKEPEKVETKEPEQIETKEPEKTETVDTKTEEPEKPETKEHDVPHIPDMPEPDFIDRVVIVEVEKENDKKEIQVQSNNQTEQEDKKDAAETVSEAYANNQVETISFPEDGSLVGDDAEEDFSSEFYENAESETQSESEVESDNSTNFDGDVVFDAVDSSLDILEDANEPEIEMQSEIVLCSGEDINTSYLQSIDLKLSCIIFILLFTVCERKLRYGVRSLCGRIKND